MNDRNPRARGCGEPSWTRRALVAVGTVTLLAGASSFMMPSRGLHAAGGDAASASCAAFDQRHAAWTAILRRHVRDAKVDYAGLKHRGDGALSRYVHALGSVRPEDYAQWSREERLAFWINAYNAYTIRLILDHYPIAGIRSIGLLPGAAFRRTVVPVHPLVGGALSLNHIEHEILRKEFQEPRIHFAIVCASESCPALRSEAYTAADLERQLEEQARAFIRDPSKNRFDAGSRTLYLSSIFEWFREDFERAAGSLVEYVSPSVDAPTAAALREPGVRIEFLDYDWSLNGR